MPPAGSSSPRIRLFTSRTRQTSTSGTAAITDLTTNITQKLVIYPYPAIEIAEFEEGPGPPIPWNLLYDQAANPPHAYTVSSDSCYSS